MAEKFARAYGGTADDHGLRFSTTRLIPFMGGFGTTNILRNSTPKSRSGPEHEHESLAKMRAMRVASDARRAAENADPSVRVRPAHLDPVKRLAEIDKLLAEFAKESEELSDSDYFSAWESSRPTTKSCSIAPCDEAQHCAVALAKGLKIQEVLATADEGGVCRIASPVPDEFFAVIWAAGDCENDLGSPTASTDRSDIDASLLEGFRRLGGAT